MPAGPEYSAETAVLGKYQNILQFVSNQNQAFSQVALLVPILEILMSC